MAWFIAKMRGVVHEPYRVIEAGEKVHLPKQKVDAEGFPINNKGKRSSWLVPMQRYAPEPTLPIQANVQQLNNPNPDQQFGIPDMPPVDPDSAYQQSMAPILEKEGNHHASVAEPAGSAFAQTAPRPAAPVADNPSPVSPTELAKSPNVHFMGDLPLPPKPAAPVATPAPAASEQTPEAAPEAPVASTGDQSVI